MKFPSTYSVIRDASQTFLRFPLAILLAVIATVFSIREAHVSNQDYHLYFWYYNVITSAYLGMLLSIALTVWAEKRGFSVGTRLSLQFPVVVFSALYYFAQPDHYTQQAVIRFFLYALGLHWLIACIAFSRMDTNGFWVFNKRLFLRMATSLLYTAVLYIGLALLLLAIDQLFRVNASSKLYPDIWLVLIGLLNTWFFLSGFPADYQSPAAVTNYPKGLRIFIQFVLLPILMVYLLFLYVLLLGIVFTGTWPYGGVSWLVLGFSVAGILAILLAWPLRGAESDKWISGYSRFFYLALFPLIVLLLIAIWKRVAVYGITELRYFGLLLALWLLCMALYFLLSKRKSIRVIPLSLCVAAFLVSFGPWGAAGVSMYSQRHRLKELLTKDKIMVDGKISGRGAQVSLNDHEEIRDITRYILEMHGYHVLQPWFRENLDSLIETAPRRGYYADFMRLGIEQDAVLRAMKFRLPASMTDGYEDNFVVTRMDDSNAVLTVRGYDHLVRKMQLNRIYLPWTAFRIGDKILTCRLDSEGNRLTLKPDNDSALVMDLSPVVTFPKFQYATGTYYLTKETMTLSAENSRWDGMLVLQQFSGILKKREKHITSLSGYLLIKEK
jgi:Domain of unknown function (DUF4153)